MIFLFNELDTRYKAGFDTFHTDTAHCTVLLLLFGDPRFFASLLLFSPITLYFTFLFRGGSYTCVLYFFLPRDE